MDYENFKEDLLEGLKEGLYERGIEDPSIRTQRIEKLNGGYEAVQVTPADSHIGVTLNMDAYFKAYENGTDMSDIIAKVVDTAVSGIENTPDVDIASLTDYEQMRGKLTMDVVSAETNAKMLANVPHQDMEDMAVVYRFMLDSGSYGNATILVTNALIENMGVTPEQLHQDALENAPQLRPIEFTGMSQIVIDKMGPEMAEMMGITAPLDPRDEMMTIASTKDMNHGAGIIAYETFMEQAAERVGGDFYVIPSSIHELILVPDNGQLRLEELKDMVLQVNATEVQPEDKLTDSVYHYDAKNKIFELGEKYEARQQAQDVDVKLDEKSEGKDSLLGDLAAKKDEVAKQPKKEAQDKAVNKNKGGEAI